MGLFQKGKCDICGQETSLRQLDIGKNVNGKHYCGDCYYCTYKRFSAPPLPERFQKKKISLKFASLYTKRRFYDLKLEPSYTWTKYFFHTLFVYSKSFDLTELVCIENSTGKLYHITITICRCNDTGPDAGSDTYSAQIFPIAITQLQILLNSVPYNERYIFNGLNMTNTKQYLEVSYFKDNEGVYL